VKHLCGGLEGGANGAELDVREDNSGVGRVLLNILRLARVSSASTTGGTKLGGISGVGRVEPEHVDRMVIPQGHNEDVSASKRSSHLVEATKGLEGRSVTKDSLLGIAERLGDGVSGNTLNGGVTVGIGLAVLDVEALDLRELGAGADELGDNSHLLGGIEGHAGAVEVLYTHAVALLHVSVML
jgi:hypothetical protein